MLRNVFVLAIAAVGFLYAFQGAFFGLLFYLWIAYFRPEQWVWDPELVTRLNLSYVAGACVVVGALISRTRLRFNLRVALLLIFLAHTLATTVFGLVPDQGWPLWTDFLKTIVMSYLIITLVTDAASLRLVLMVIALSLGLEAAKQGWIGILLHPGSRNDNTLPMLGDNNGVAVGMLMLVPVLTSLAASCASRYQRLFWRFLALGVLYRGIVTYSRGAFLACGVLALFYVLRSHRRLPALAGVFVAALLVAPVLPTEFWDRMNTIAMPTEDNADVSSVGRVHFWNVAVEMAKDRPLIGVGYNSFNYVYDRYDDLDGQFGRGRSVHSVWFGLLGELGIPGLLLFLAQLALAFRACWRGRAAAKLGPEFANLRHFAFALEGAFVAFIAGGTFLPFQYTEMVWHFLALTIALDLIARNAFAAAAARPRAAAGDTAGLTPSIAMAS